MLFFPALLPPQRRTRKELNYIITFSAGISFFWTYLRINIHLLIVTWAAL